MKSIIVFLFFILVLFYLTQYVQNIVPSAYNHYKYANEKFSMDFFHTKSSKFMVFYN